MSDLSIELQSTENHRFSFKDTSLYPVPLNPLDILPRQN